MIDIPLTDEIDHEILMHRDVHFGGSFSAMLEYYEEENKGVQEEFDLDRIEELQQIEEQAQENLSEFLLSEEEKEKVEKAKSQYLALRDLYEVPSSLAARAVADLILSEDIEAKEEIARVCEQGESAIPLLIGLLEQDLFFDPLFPGYGFAPGHAAECLGKLQAAASVAPLFEALSRAGFFIEESILKALHQIGSPAKDFLVRVLKKKPITKDNENAVIALLAFRDDPVVIRAALSLLFEPEISSRRVLCSYLILFYEYIEDPKVKKEMDEFMKDKETII